MPCPACTHRMPNGSFCGSPALRGQNLCYFHNRQQSSRQQLAQDRRRANTLRLYFPPLETIEDVQIALWAVVNSLADDRMDPARAAALLFGLQQVSLHLRNQPVRCPTPPFFLGNAQLPSVALEGNELMKPGY